MLKHYHLIIFIFINSISVTVYGQNVSKRGGLCFRIDDNQTIRNFEKFSEAFNKNGYHFSFAINTVKNPYGGYEKFDFSYARMVRNLINQGHELMDHTPDHSTAYFTVDPSLVNSYEHLPGVDHISDNKICLKVDTVYLNSDTSETLIDVKDNLIISHKNGEFKSFSDNSSTYFAVYIPKFKKIFVAAKSYSINSNDQDTLLLESLWREEVHLGQFSNLSYHKLIQSDVRMRYDAINLLADRTKKLFESYRLPLPRTWIQPGGKVPNFDKNDVKTIYGRSFAYLAGAVYVKSSIKCFNEVDPEKNARYGMMWGDFFEDFTSFEACKERIADKLAKHYVLIGHSHFYSLLGGFDGYLNRVDSILKWCKSNNIPVRTYSEWSNYLYDSIPDPYENIIPDLGTDLNGDSFPDGYFKNFGIFEKDKTGVSFSTFFSNDSAGRICKIANLTGVEKGKNIISFYHKSATADTINLSCSFLGTKSHFPTRKIPSSKDWNQYSTSINIPSDATYITINITAKNGVPLKISKVTEISLRKISVIDLELPNLESNINEEFKPVDLNQALKNSFYSASQLQWKFSSKNLQLSLDTVKSLLNIKKPEKFWIGTDTIFCHISNKDGESKDTFFLCLSNKIKICIGSSFNFNPEKILKSVHWSSFPLDTTINDSILINILRPDTTTNYTLDCVYENGEKQKINFSVIINHPINNISQPEGETIICGDNKTSYYTVSKNSPQIKDYWLLTQQNSGVIEVSGDTCIVKWNPNFYGKTSLIVSNENECGIYISDPLDIIRSKPPKAFFEEKYEGNKVIFTNRSTNYTNNYWNFGDNQVSEMPNPVHTYEDGNYWTSLTVTNENCSDSILREIMIPFDTTIEGSKESIFRIFPNPVKNGLIKVEGDVSECYLQIYDIKGTVRIVGNVKLPTTLNLQKLAKGIYFIKLSADKYYHIEKFLFF